MTLGSYVVGNIIDATASTFTVKNLTILDMLASTFGGFIQLTKYSTGKFTDINLIRSEVDLILGGGPSGIFDDMG